MRIEIDWNGDTTPADLEDGRVTVGGDQTDGIVLPGMERSLLELTLEKGRATVKAKRALRVGAALFPPHVSRLLLAGEEVVLADGIVIRRPADPEHAKARKAKETAFVARELLGGLLPQPQDTRSATLTCVTGADVGVVFPLAFGESVLGRSDEVDVRLHDRSVSRHHARLVKRGRDFLVEDLRTTNGIYVNGLKVKGFRALESGDVIELGHTILRYDGPARAPGELTVVGPAPRADDDETKAERPEHRRAAKAEPAAGTPPPPPLDAVDEERTQTATESGPSKSALTEAVPPRPQPKRRRPALESVLAALGLVLAVAGFTVVVAMLHHG